VLILARIITGLVSIALAEGMLWMLGYPSWRNLQVSSASEFEPDPELGWKNRKGHYDLVAPDRPPFRYTNWSQGRRATSAQAPLQDDPRPRILLVGDSYVYGYGLGDADTFAWRFGQRHPELQVSNYGTPGYGTYQSSIAMKRALSTNPAKSGAAVFYLLNGFHEDRNVADPGWIRVARHPDNGGFFPFAVLSGGELEDRRTNGDQIWTLSRKLRTAAMAEEYTEMAEAWSRVRKKRAVTQALLVRMDSLAQSAGAKFTVILFDLYPSDRKTYREFLASRGIASIDCDHAELNDKNLRQPDGHPNRKLNELLSQWVDPASTLANVSAVQ
jgi:hypothetical protein